MSSNWYKKSQRAYDNIGEGELFISDAPKPPIFDDKAEIEDEDKWIPVTSSFITHVAYDKERKFMDVKIGRDKYTYVGVPRRVFNNFMKSDSKGAYYNLKIKDKYKRLNTK